MRRIHFDRIKKAVSDSAVRANIRLRPDALALLKNAYRTETNQRAKKLLADIIENARIAAAQKLAICQDTGMPVVFVDIGSTVTVGGKGLQQAILEGIETGYRKGNLRASIVRDPLRPGKQTSYFGPAIIHYDYNNSDRLKITVLPKGFGCENKSKLKMFLPTAQINEIKNFIVETVKEAGPDACPPYIIGVGIGGTADYASLLAKKALLKNLTGPSSKIEKQLLQAINQLHIGPMGLGGVTTALSVRVVSFPTHIAGLPVAVNISCHALRSATVVL